MKEQRPLKGLQQDVLKEVANIGTGNAATAFSNLVQKPIDMQVPQVKMIHLQDIDQLFGEEEVVIAVFLQIEGDISGSMFFFLPYAKGQPLLHDLLGEQKQADTFDDLSQSTLQEIGNILSGSYLSALADFTGLHLVPTVPSVAIDLALAIFNYGLIEHGKDGDQVIFIDTVFTEQTEVDSNPLHGQFFLLPDPDSFTKLFQAVGVE